MAVRNRRAQASTRRSAKRAAPSKRSPDRRSTGLRQPKSRRPMAKQIFRKRRQALEAPIIDLKGLHKTYGETGVPVHALAGVSLKVPRGEMLAVMGPSGSGKTSLLNMIGLLDTPDRGSVMVGGQDPSQIKRRKLPAFRQRQIGLVFQQKNLIPTLTALENVYLPFRYTSGAKSVKREQAEEGLRLVGMFERANHRPSQLSGGEQQRVAIARALVNSPAMVLADEPTGELDSKTGHSIVKLMQNLNAKLGQTFVLVTHNEAVAAECHRIVRMQDGKIVSEHRPRKRRAA